MSQNNPLTRELKRDLRRQLPLHPLESVSAHWPAEALEQSRRYFVGMQYVRLLRLLFFSYSCEHSPELAPYTRRA